MYCNSIVSINVMMTKWGQSLLRLLSPGFFVCQLLLQLEAHNLEDGKKPATFQMAKNDKKAQSTRKNLDVVLNTPVDLAKVLTKIQVEFCSRILFKFYLKL